MKTLVLTGANPEMMAIHQETSPSKRLWAQRHGYDYLELLQWETVPAVVWQKMAVIQKMLRLYDVVVWLDADSVVTNPVIPVQSFIPSSASVLNVSEDWGPCDEGDRWFWFNTGNMVLCAAPGWENLFGSMWEIGRKHWWEQWGFEQSTLQTMKQTDEWGRLIAVLPGTALNAVPRSVQPTTLNPWDAQCFLAHITGVPNVRRLEILSREGFR